MFGRPLTPFLAVLLAVLMASACASTLQETRPGELGLTVGPLDLPAAKGGGEHAHAHAHASLPQDFRLFRFPEDGWVTSFHPAMVDEAGTAVPGKLLHHVVIGDHDQADFLCEISDHGHEFRFMLASGGELTVLELPDGFGIPVDRDTMYVAGGVFANNTDRDYPGVSFRGTLGFEAKSSGRVLRPAVPVWIDVIPTCPEDGYMVPGSQRDVKTRPFRFPFAGELLLAAGHLHDEGVSLRVFRKDTGEELARFDPTYREAKIIQSMPLVRFDPPVRIDPAVDYVVESIYDNSMPHMVTAMGIAVAFVAPDDPSDVPGLDDEK